MSILSTIEAHLEPGGPTFEEGNHRYQALVSGCALPLLDDDRVFRMGGAVVRIGIEKDDFGQVSVQVREVLKERKLAFVSSGENAPLQTFTGRPFSDLVASRNNLYAM